MKHNHDFFTDGTIMHKLRLGIAAYSKGVFCVKCYGCYKLLPADTENFHRKDKNSIRTKCKECVTNSDNRW